MPGERTCHCRCGRITYDNRFTDCLCEPCYNEYYFTCDSCGDICDNDNYCGDGVCVDCWNISSGEPDTNYGGSSHELNKIASKTFQLNKSRRYAGFEMELCTSGQFPSISDMRGLGKFCKDRSITPYHSDDKTIEFVSNPANGDALMQLIQDATLKINKAEGTYVNNSCGLHVHVEAKDLKEFQLKNLFYWWQALEPIFFSLVAGSREKNHCCKSWKGHNFSNRCIDRYRAMNFCSLTEHGTVEFRLHHGTTDCRKIQTWCLLLIAFVDVFSNVWASPNRLKTVANLSTRGKLLFVFQQLALPLSLRKGIIKTLKRLKRLHVINKESRVLNLKTYPQRKAA